MNGVMYYKLIQLVIIVLTIFYVCISHNDFENNLFWRLLNGLFYDLFLMFQDFVKNVFAYKREKFL